MKPLKRAAKIVPLEHLYPIRRNRINMTNKAIVLIAWLDSTPLYWEQHRALIARQP